MFSDGRIFTIELIDGNDEKEVFEILDTIVFEGDRYTVMIPYYETAEEYAMESSAAVTIMKNIIDKATNESLSEAIEDEVLLYRLYDIFKSRHGDEYDFID